MVNEHRNIGVGYLERTGDWGRSSKRENEWNE